MRKPWEEVNQEGASTKKIKAPGRDGEARVGTRESEEEGGCVSPPGLCWVLSQEGLGGTGIPSRQAPCLNDPRSQRGSWHSACQGGGLRTCIYTCVCAHTYNEHNYFSEVQSHLPLI